MEKSTEMLFSGDRDVNLEFARLRIRLEEDIGECSDSYLSVGCRQGIIAIHSSLKLTGTVMCHRCLSETIYCS